MKIGLFFGSFNPIHTGHLVIAQHVLNFFSDKVYFIVSPQNPFKKAEDLLDIQSRILLVNAAIDKNTGFSVSDIELNLPRPSYTITTLEYLTKKQPNNNFFLIIGSDNFSNISSWKSSETLLLNYKFIIYERPGFLIDSKIIRSNIIYTKAPFINISSTQIRKLVQTEKSIQYLVPQKVEYLIKNNNYYR